MSGAKRKPKKTESGLIDRYNGSVSALIRGDVRDE